MEFTGNELILAHNSPQGLLKLADLLQYIEDNIQTGSSGSAIQDLEFTVTDMNIENQGRFQLAIFPTPAQNLNHVRYLVVGDQRIVTNAIGTVWVGSAPTDDYGYLRFSILTVADGFSKILYCSMEYSRNEDGNLVYSLSYRDTPYVEDRQY